MCDRHSRMTHQIVQQIEFLWRQAQNRTSFAHDPAWRIEFDVPDHDRHFRVGRGCGRTPDRRSQPGCELLDGEGLGDVVIGPSIESFDLVRFPIPNR